jgi:plastocyanin
MQQVIRQAGMVAFVGLVLAACGGSDGGGNGPAGVPAAVNKDGGEFQLALVNQGFDFPVAVKVVDANGDPVNGITVTWTVQSGPVNVAAATTVTAGVGVAVMLIDGGATAGTGVVRATIAEVAGNTDFTLTVSDADRLVQVANNTFLSHANLTVNPAVDTITAGQKVVWAWLAGNHSVESTGSPSFASSTTLNTPANAVKPSFTLTFPTAGTYQYDCAVHGSAMTGRIVVQ